MSNLQGWDKIISNLFKAFFYGLIGWIFLRALLSGSFNILTFFLLIIPLWFLNRCLQSLAEAVQIYESMQGRK